jgi:hypothetical protein
MLFLTFALHPEHPKILAILIQTTAKANPVNLQKTVRTAEGGSEDFRENAGWFFRKKKAKFSPPTTLLPCAPSCSSP